MRDLKVFYFDVETTGTDPVKNDITQISGMIEINREIIQTFNFRCQPFNYDTISPEALEVTGIGVDELKSFPDPREVYVSLMRLLGDFVNKFDRSDKFYISGYNVRFDVDFLYQFFKKNNDPYFGSWFNWKLIDPLPILHFMEYQGLIKLDNYKLGTVCNHYQVEIKAHDALSDITATRAVLAHLTGVLTKAGYDPSIKA